MFYLKKLIGSLVMPLPLGLILLLLACVFWLLHKRGLAVFSFLSGFSLILFLSIPAISDRIVQPLERAYPAYQNQPVDFVVVLGGGHRSDQDIPAPSQLRAGSLHRLTEGLRIYDLNDSAKLTFSGYAAGDKQTHAQLMSGLAQDMGVLPSHIIAESRPRDTAEEARYLKPLLLGKPFALVTSASHMPRAMYLFEKEGLSPIPAPCDYLSKRSKKHSVFYYLPNAKRLDASTRAIHEYLGLAWVKLMEMLGA